MHYLTKKDVSKRIHFNCIEPNLLIFKSIYYNFKLPYNVRVNAKLNINKFNKKSFQSRIRNRCIITGRARSIDRYTHLSRHIFKMFAAAGKLPGIRVSSW